MVSKTVKIMLHVAMEIQGAGQGGGFFQCDLTV